MKSLIAIHLPARCRTRAAVAARGVGPCALALLCLVAAACSREVDPCEGQAGACVTVEVRAQTTEQATALTVLVALGDAPPVSRMTQPPDGVASGFPLRFPLLLGEFSGALRLAVEARLPGDVLYRGTTSATVEAGAHQLLTVDLLPDGGEGGEADMGTADLTGVDLTGAPDLAVSLPPARYSGALSAFPSRRSAVLFGGFTSLGGVIGDTWEWNGKSWTQLSPVSVPRARAADMVYDATRDALVLFGGYTGRGTSDDETWTFTPAGEWIRLGIAGPKPRAETALAYDPRGRVLMVGGYSPESAVIVPETWELPSAAGSNWRQLSMSTPKARGAGLVNAGGVFYFIGSDDNSGVRAWRYDPGSATPSWTLVLFQAGSVPAARMGAALAYDSGLGVIVISGGQSPDGSTVYDDTWGFSPKDLRWVQINSIDRPTARTGARMDLFNNTLLYFGGALLRGVTAKTYNDTWVLSKASEWRRLLP